MFINIYINIKIYTNINVNINIYTNIHIYIKIDVNIHIQVINATIEVQAAADAAAMRLKSWLIQQRKIEDEKR